MPYAEFSLVLEEARLVVDEVRQVLGLHSVSCHSVLVVRLRDRGCWWIGSVLVVTERGVGGGATGVVAVVVQSLLRAVDYAWVKVLKRRRVSRCRSHSGHRC